MLAVDAKNIGKWIVVIVTMMTGSYCKQLLLPNIFRSARLSVKNVGWSEREKHKQLFTPLIILSLRASLFPVTWNGSYETNLVQCSRKHGKSL